MVAGHRRGWFTRNDGTGWKHTPTHNWTGQIGVLLDNGIDEAWDTSEHNFGSVQQGVWFHTLALP